MCIIRLLSRPSPSKLILFVSKVLIIHVAHLNLNINLTYMHRMSLVEGVAIAAPAPVSKPLIHVHVE